jgi:hypothetical protein
MNWFKKCLIPIGTLAIVSCGKTETTNSAIKRETDLMDVRLYEGAPSVALNSEVDTRVGFDENGKESRMLLYFPKLQNLWDSKVIISSIAIVELLLNCTDVEVNPENIELVPMAQSWSPFATWSTRDIISGKTWTAAGGDIDASLPGTTPSLRINANNSDAKELAFNITTLVQRMILQGYKNYGFMIRVKQSALNSKNEMWFRTSNNADENVRPSSILTFTTADSVGQ